MVNVRKDVFKELEKVKGLVNGLFFELDIRDLCKLLSRLGTYHYNKKTVLDKKEKRLYNVLIKNSYNPFTVYRWALLERVPKDIQFQLKNYEISQKKASRLNFKRKHETDMALQLNIKRMGLSFVRGM